MEGRNEEEMEGRNEEEMEEKVRRRWREGMRRRWRGGWKDGHWGYSERERIRETEVAEHCHNKICTTEADVKKKISQA